MRRCALDSVPKLRGAVIRYLAGRAEPADTTTVGIGVVHPTRTVRRALEDLAAHGVVQRKSAGQGKADSWELSGRARAWIDAARTLPETLESPLASDTSPQDDDWSADAADEPLADDLTCAGGCGFPLDPVYAELGWTHHGGECLPDERQCDCPDCKEFR